MKKLLTIILALALAASLTACAKGDDKTPQNSEINQGISEVAPDEKPVSITGTFGRISNVVGNEIEMETAKLPEVDVPEVEPSEDGTVPAMGMTAAISATEPGAEVGAENRTELEYTGEKKSFVVPTGVKITDTMGNEITLADLKKGSVIICNEDAEGNITGVIKYE